MFSRNMIMNLEMLIDCAGRVATKVMQNDIEGVRKYLDMIDIWIKSIRNELDLADAIKGNSNE